MGGLGSGRPGGSGRSKVENVRSIDVNWLRRSGYLRSPCTGELFWTCEGETVGTVNFRYEQNRLRLLYRVRISGGEWQHVDQPITIARLPCRFGGTRPYFLCPGLVDGKWCGRRVMKLYGGGRYFLCRHCYTLVYASQSEVPWDRALRRANKIRRRLGGPLSMDRPFPAKPRGMWRRTYERLCDQVLDAEMWADELLLAHWG
jgi:hypothetical protein